MEKDEEDERGKYCSGYIRRAGKGDLFDAKDSVF